MGTWSSPTTLPSSDPSKGSPKAIGKNGLLYVVLRRELQCFPLTPLGTLSMGGSTTGCLSRLRLALGNDRNMESKIKSLAVCAGSGASVLGGCRADLLVTGEMSHHEVLDFVHKGISVILTEHSNCERGYLRLVKEKLVKALGEEVTILVSKMDRDPLQIG